jgi:glycosyltransferase involved in cell wall biosynthesis
MSSATALVACGSVDGGPLSLGFKPAKLYEYIASGVPTIYVGHRQGEAAHVLGEYDGCHAVEFGDVDGAISALQAALHDGVHQRDLGPLSRRARAQELAALFDTII